MAAGINAAIVGTLSSIATQVITTGRVDFGSALQSGAVSGLVAGVTSGVLGNAPGSSSGSGLADGTTGSAATVTPGTNGATQLSQGSWADFVKNPGSYAANTAIRSGISAAINSAVYGGSFGTAFLNGVVADAAAIGANGIGANSTAYSIQNVLGHALLGCAAAALRDSECAGGAIGGAASALVAPLIRDGLYAGSESVNTIADGKGSATVITSYNNRDYNAAITALSLMTGGSLAALLGRDAVSAANAAQNEATNNATSPKVVTVYTLPGPMGAYSMMTSVLSALMRMPPPGMTSPLPGKPNQFGLDDEYSLQGTPNQSGQFTNWGTSLPATLDDIYNSIIGLPNQAGQWMDSVKISPSLCIAFAAMCGPSVIASVADNNRAGKSAEKDVAGNLSSQGFEIQPQVSFTSGATRAVADFAVNGTPGAIVKIPSGYVAEDLNGAPLLDSNGRPITSFNLNEQGQAVIEVKTGGASLTKNQNVVYPGIQSGTATGTKVGTNAGEAGMSGSLPKTPVVVIRKQ
ncbi:DUF637 domain-containing protein [Herbaspirillum sp. NPDC087042]|uniref:DUF637 domain-containing protein n=1 Tax=Herbaspirillum sp. NPDC087042 TaxID=3364004 RepID=UPI0037FE8B28